MTERMGSTHCTGNMRWEELHLLHKATHFWVNSRLGCSKKASARRLGHTTASTAHGG